MSDTDQQLKDNLLASGGIEQFIQNERIPLFDDDFHLLLIPPEGVQPGDTYHRYHHLGGGPGDIGTIEFFSPEGESRGFAQIVGVSEKEFDALRDRYEQAMEQYYPKAKEGNLMTTIAGMFLRK